VVLLFLVVKNKNMTNKEWALYYLSKGFSIIPVGKDINEKRDKKMPLISSWLDYQTTKPTENQVIDWWTKWPNAKIAIICGQVSGLAVVDIDNINEFQKLNIRIPQAPIVKTKKGFHYYFKITEEQKKIVLKNGDIHYGEIQANGSYVIAPPSKHHDQFGNVDGDYSWSIGLDDIEMKTLDLSIFEPIVGKAKKTNILEIAKGQKDGNRNNSLVSFIGSLLLLYPESQWDRKVWSTIVAWNDANNPPLDDKTLETAYKNICEKESEKRKSIKEMFKNQKTKKDAMYQISQTIIDDCHIKTIDEEKPEVYTYKNGYYKKGQSKIESIIIRLLEECVTKHDITEIINKIKIQTYCERKDFDKNINYINLQNGVYDIKNKTFKKHSAKKMFLNILPVHYNPKAGCDKIKTFLAEVLQDWQVPIIQEWFGFCLYRKYVVKKAMILVGEKNTGKTTLIRLLTKFLGEENISGISLQALATDKFAVSQLYGKYANIYDDLSFKDIGDNGKFKIATGGGFSTGEYKFGNAFNFESYAKLVFACNKIPNIKDTSDDAYFDRWIILRFDNTIQNKNPLLIEELTKKNEMSGLFNWAIEGLYKLLQRYDFSYAKSSDEVRTEMMSSGSSIASFAYDYLEQRIGETISKERMYNHYCDYCHAKNVAIETIELLGRNLPASAPFVRHTKISNKTAWLNVGFKNEAPGKESEYEY
jgi:P4 family phage/plasmid primase-like protien